LFKTEKLNKYIY